MFFSIFLIFLGTSVTSYAFLNQRKLNKKYKQSLRQLDNYTFNNAEDISKPIIERLFSPIMTKITDRLVKVTISGRKVHYAQKLLAAGEPVGFDASKMLSLKVLGALLFFILGILVAFILNATFGLKVAVAISFLIAGLYLPDIWLDTLVNRRQAAIRYELSDTLDLLIICIEAGLGFDSALGKIIKHGKGPITSEFAKVLYEIQLGIPRGEAFRNLAQRNSVEGLKNFVSALVQADIFGISIGNVLRAQANEIRTKSRQLAEERAQKTSVKIVFPLILCIFPAIFVVILGPAAMRIMAMFSR